MVDLDPEYTAVSPSGTVTVTLACCMTLEVLPLTAIPPLIM